MILARDLYIQARLRMSGSIPLLPTYTSIREDSTEQPQFVVLITERSHFMQFHENIHHFQIYGIILSLIRFGIGNTWPHYSSI